MLVTLQGKYTVNYKRQCNFKMFSKLKPRGGTALLLLYKQTLYPDTLPTCPNCTYFCWF